MIRQIGFLGIFILTTACGALKLEASQIISGSNCQIQGSGNVVISDGNGCGNIRGIEGSGNLVKETREVDNFSAVSASGPISVTLSTGNNYQIVVEAEDNIISDVVTTEVNGVLNVSLKSGSYTLKRDINVYITAPSYTALQAEGQVKVNDSGSYLGNDIRLDVSGQSEILLDEFKFVSSSRIDVSGQSQITVFVDSQIDSLESSGQSDVVVHGVDRIVNLDISGQSDVQIQGGAQINNQNISGQSEVDFF